MGKKLQEKINEYQEREWARYKKRKRSRLKNTDFTIISSNCGGMLIYYDMELPYLTPTVNLSIEMNDFVRMAENLEWYMGQELVEVKGESSCPVGMLGDVRIQLVHYESFDEGFRKWEERKRRINWDNLFFMGVEKVGGTYETIQKFDRLPYENKVIFTHVRYPEFSSAYYIKGFEDRNELGVVTFFKKQFLKRRYLDDFDYVKFLNG